MKVGAGEGSNLLEINNNRQAILFQTRNQLGEGWEKEDRGQHKRWGLRGVGSAVKNGKRMKKDNILPGVALLSVIHRRWEQGLGAHWERGQEPREKLRPLTSKHPAGGSSPGETEGVKGRREGVGEFPPLGAVRQRDEDLNWVAAGGRG